MWLIGDMLPARNHSAAFALSGILIFILVVETVWLRLLRWSGWGRAMLFSLIANGFSIGAIILLVVLYPRLFALSFLTVFTTFVVVSVLVEGVVLAAGQRFKGILNAFLTSLATNCASFLLLYLTVKFFLH